MKKENESRIKKESASAIPLADLLTFRFLDHSLRFQLKQSSQVSSYGLFTLFSSLISLIWFLFVVIISMSHSADWLLVWTSYVFRFFMDSGMFIVDLLIEPVFDLKQRLFLTNLNFLFGFHESREHEWGNTRADLISVEIYYVPFGVIEAEYWVIIV